jgi:hypothetical protein
MLITYLLLTGSLFLAEFIHVYTYYSVETRACANTRRFWLTVYGGLVVLATFTGAIALTT